MAEEKQYQSLYRKYRPQTPAEVLGQEHVVRALVGSIRDSRLAHAFLFCGPRGTGKTSTARILAKMVNCENGPTSEPCGKCEDCLRIAAGSHLDVVEIDAASHGGVDDARELRERAPTAPAQGREKVYILDEAQRLSREAFDALLKLFEEPPPGVRFVLCTTEPHKMPATIVGRCQRFDFRRAPADLVADHLTRIATEEGVALDRDAALAIARQSEGSFRDALSLLDQASVIGGEAVGEETLEQLLGAPHQEIQYGIADAVAVGDTAGVFELVARLVQEGQDIRHATSESLQHFRNLLLAASAPGQADLIDVPPDEYERLRAQASKFPPVELSRVIALLLAAQTDMRWTTSPRLTLELALIRATMPEADPAPEALLGRIERLERLAGMEGGGTPAAREQPVAAVPTKAERPVPVPGEGTPRSTSPARREEPPAPSTAAPETAAESSPAERGAGEPAEPEPVAITTGSVDVGLLRRSWPTLVERLRSTRQMILAANLESVTPTSYDGEQLELAFPPGRSYAVDKVKGKMPELQAVLKELFGIAPLIRCVERTAVAAGPTDVPDEEPPMSEEAALARLQSELDATIADD